MKTHKVTSTKIKTKQPTEPTENLAKVYYVGNHPHLRDSMGVAAWDEKQAAWLYKPELTHTEWYRVRFESLVFENNTTS